MAMRTVINRAAKMFINTSNDSDLFAGAINNTIADEYDNERQVKDAEVVDENAETLDEFLNAPSEPVEAVKVVGDENITEDKKEPETGGDVAEGVVKEVIEQPAEDIPAVDRETGEVVEEISFFEGETTQIKE